MVPRTTEFVHRRANRIAAAKLAGGYAAVAALWIVISDLLLASTADLSDLVLILSELKGLAFVAVTAVVLYLLAYNTLERMQVQENLIRQAYMDALSAATGGKLELLTEEELQQELGEPLGEAMRVSTPVQLSEARAKVAAEASVVLPDENITLALLSPVGEALNNALRHAGGGTVRVFCDEDRVQVLIADEGPGIDFGALPKVVLVSGYSTSATLGLGFTMIIRMSQRVLLSTRPGGTQVVIETDGQFSEDE